MLCYPRTARGIPEINFYYFYIVQIHPRLQGGAFSTPAGNIGQFFIFVVAIDRMRSSAAWKAAVLKVDRLSCLKPTDCCWQHHARRNRIIFLDLVKMGNRKNNSLKKMGNLSFPALTWDHSSTK